jgi:Uncharacterised nucleotidyltransferase
LSRTAAFLFLCESLAWPERSIDPLKLRRSIQTKTFRWASLVSLAHEYEVASPLSLALRKLELGDARLSSILNYLDELAVTVRQRNTLVLAQVREVGKILNASNVVPVLLKGGANLLRGLYPDPAMRVMADLDMLVPAEALDACVGALRKAGFKLLTDYRYPGEHHYPPIGHPDFPLPLELHHRVLAHPYDRFLTADEMRESAVAISFDGVSLAVPSPTCAVVQNIAHAQLSNHDYLYGRIDLRVLVDFVLLTRTYASEIDWHATRGRFDCGSARIALDFHLLCARELFRISTPLLERVGATPRMLFSRARYLVGHPHLLDLSVRLTRPWLLLRRELSEPSLRRRLAGNVIDSSWWTRHLRWLAGRT